MLINDFLNSDKLGEILMLVSFMPVLFILLYNVITSGEEVAENIIGNE